MVHNLDCIEDISVINSLLSLCESKFTDDNTRKDAIKMWLSDTEHKYGIIHNDNVVSLATVRKPEKEFNTYTIEWVCTHNDYVGQGLAVSVLNHIVKTTQNLHNEGVKCDFTLYCLEEYIPFYEKAGFKIAYKRQADNYYVMYHPPIDE